MADFTLEWTEYKSNTSGNFICTQCITGSSSTRFTKALQELGNHIHHSNERFRTLYNQLL